MARLCMALKKVKQRIIVFLQLTGTEKLPLLIKGQYVKLRCFKGVWNLLAMYKSNHKAWMTSNIFQEWLRDLDCKMSVNKRNILLIINNCTTHSVINNFKAVEVLFFHLM